MVDKTYLEVIEYFSKHSCHFIFYAAISTQTSGCHISNIRFRWQSGNLEMVSLKRKQNFKYISILNCNLVFIKIGMNFMASPFEGAG